MGCGLAAQLEPRMVGCKQLLFARVVLLRLVMLLAQNRFERRVVRYASLDSVSIGVCFHHCEIEIHRIREKDISLFKLIKEAGLH
ncbi:hypothetical protein D3C80_1888740 [compost metagenome]